MAAIESLDGISRVNEFDYQVTKVVTVGSDIDDVAEATFTIKDGGYLAFITGCTTSFTRCTFTEQSTAKTYGSTGSGSAANKARFRGTTAPKFYGCEFYHATGMSHSSFDIPATANPEFRRDEFGRKCRVYINNSTFYWNHFMSPRMTIDGLVVDLQGGKADLSFEIPPPINDLTVIDNSTGSTVRHVTFLCANWPSNSTYTVRGLGARNVATWSGHATKKLRLVDPKGDIPRSFDNGAEASPIDVLRTYKSVPFDASAGSPVTVKTYVKNTLTNDVIISDYSNNVNEELDSYFISAGSTNLTYRNQYTRGFYKYGYQTAILNFDVSERLDGSPIDDGNVLMLPDTSITETDKAVVDAYSITTTVSDSAVTITGGAITTRQAYDAICAHLEDNWKAVDLRAGRAGDMLDVGSRTLSLPSVDGDLQSSGAITVASIAEGRVIKDSPNVTIGTLPATLTLDNAILNIGSGADVTEYTELNGGSYKASSDGEYIARGKSASIIDVNGFTITVVTAALPTPSTMNFVADGDTRWAIYDNNNGFVESGSGNKVLAHTGGVDAGVWTIVSHKKGYAGQIDRWTSDDGSVTNLTFVGSQIRRSTGEVATTNDPFLDATTSVSAGRMHTLIANKSVGPQQIINAQQFFLNTDAGLNWIRQNQPPDYPTWAAMNGITYLLTKEGFTYDSVSGVTPEAAISATLISSASHDNILLTNGGVTVSGGALTGADIATAVWAAQRTEHAAEGTMGEAQSAAADMATITAQNTQT